MVRSGTWTRPLLGGGGWGFSPSRLQREGRWGGGIASRPFGSISAFFPSILMQKFLPKEWQVHLSHTPPHLIYVSGFGVVMCGVVWCCVVLRGEPMEGSDNYTHILVGSTEKPGVGSHIARVDNCPPVHPPQTTLSG